MGWIPMETRTASGHGEIDLIGANGNGTSYPSGSPGWVDYGSLASGSAGFYYYAPPFGVYPPTFPAFIFNFEVAIGSSIAKRYPLPITPTASELVSSVYFNLPFQTTVSNTNTTTATTGVAPYSWTMDTQVYCWIAELEGSLSEPDFPPFEGLYIGSGHDCTPYRALVMTEVPLIGGSFSATCGGASIGGTIPNYGSMLGNTTAGCYLSAAIACTGPINTLGAHPPTGPQFASAIVTGFWGNDGQIKGSTTRSQTYPSSGEGVPYNGTCAWDFTNGVSIIGTGTTYPSSSVLLLPSPHVIGTPMTVYEQCGSIYAVAPDRYNCNAQFAQIDGSSYPNVICQAVSGYSADGFGGPSNTQQFNSTGSTNFENDNRRVYAQYSGGVGDLAPIIPPYPGTESSPTVHSEYECTEVVTDGLGCLLQVLTSNPINQAIGDVIDSRLLARAKPYQSFTIGQAASTTLDPCNSITGWSGFTLVSGQLQIDTSSVTTATKNISGWISEGCRYLQLTIEGVTASNQLLTVTLIDSFSGATKSYQITTGTSGSPSSLQIDMCLPLTATGVGFANSMPGAYKGLDYEDSRYPEVSDNAPFFTQGYSEQSGKYWGVSTITTISILFPSGSGLYNLSNISLVRNSPPKLTMIDVEHQIALAPLPVSPTFDNTGYILIYGETDGLKRSFEVPGKDGRIDGGDFNYPNSNRTQLSYLQARCTWDGTWSVSLPGTDVGQWYYSTFLCDCVGNGAMFDGNPLDTVRYVDTVIPNSPGTITVKGQLQLDAILAVPECGTLLGGGASTAPCTINVYQIQGGRVWGAILDDSGNTVTSLPIQTIQDSNARVGGSATSDSGGRYMTATQYQRTGSYTGPGDGPGEHSLSGPPALPLGAGRQPTYTRHTARLWAGLNPIVASYPWELQDNTGRLHICMTSNSDVVYQRANFSDPVRGWAVSSVVTSFGDVVYARMWQDFGTQEIHLLVTRQDPSTLAYSLWECISTDDGGTFTGGTLIMSNVVGSTGWYEHTGNAGMTYFTYNSGSSGPGTQSCIYRNGPDGIAWSAPFQFVDSTNTAIQVADLGWSNVCDARAFFGGLTWSPILSGESGPSLWYSMDNAQTWTRVY